MQTSATMIADSVSPSGVRICTIQCTLWRPLLAELNTYRDFSRNGASSRARSVKKTLQEVLEDTAMPTEFRREHIGMSGGDLLEGDELADAIDAVLEMRDDALRGARRLVELGVHKSIVNRYIEPFMWHTHVITATNWDNFLEQRLALLEDGRKGSDPMMYDLALAIRAELAHNIPKPLEYGQWHTPYIQSRDINLAAELSGELHGDLGAWEIIRRVSVARCAGTSYLTQDKKNRDLRDDLRIYGNLVSARPPHWSPFEHVATPRRDCDPYDPARAAKFFNLTGWASLRWFAESGVRIG